MGFGRACVRFAMLWWFNSLGGWLRLGVVGVVEALIASGPSGRMALPVHVN